MIDIKINYFENGNKSNSGGRPKKDYLNKDDFVPDLLVQNFNSNKVKLIIK
jgi:hypothetical protein